MSVGVSALSWAFGVGGRRARGLELVKGVVVMFSVEE